MSAEYIVHGGNPLVGTVHISGSKNAALPIIAASILTKEKSVIHNIPDILDVRNYLRLLDVLNITYTFDKNTLVIDPSKIKSSPLPKEIVTKMRASLLFAGPLLAIFGKVKMDFPGGCNLGKRPIDALIKGAQKLSVNIKHKKNTFYFQTSKLIGNRILVEEASVTGTESIILMSVLAKGVTQIRLAACEPHVQDLCRFLRKMGAQIKGIGTPSLTITGVKKLQGATHSIIPDYLETGTFAIASTIIPGSKLRISRGTIRNLDSFWMQLEETGADFHFEGKDIICNYTKKLKSLTRLHTRIYPGFPTDLQSPFSLLLTQAHGVTKVFETIYENRLGFLYELEKMGIKFEMLNHHQAIIIGPTALKGAEVNSLDLRAGATMVIAALLARGITRINQIDYIHRGYELFAEKLSLLGADIRIIEDHAHQQYAIPVKSQNSFTRLALKTSMD